MITDTFDNTTQAIINPFENPNAVVVDAPEWDNRHALDDSDSGSQHDAQHFEIALELAEFVSK